ncbi:bone morphogenetic protein 2-like [Oculina patagonica]
MFIALLCCLFFGATICLGEPKPPLTAKEAKVAKAVEKAMLKILGLKTPPKPKKGSKDKIPQFMLDSINKQVNESARRGMEVSETTNQKLENEGDLSARTSRRTCQKHSLYIDFSRLWGEDNWIIAPAGFHAHNCDGECSVPMGDHLSPTNHAVFQDYWHSVESTVPGPCCVPTELRPQSIIYRDDNGVIQDRVYSDMSVVSCGCR